MLKISMLESGHLFNHSDINRLKEECEKFDVDLDLKLHKYLFSKDHANDRSLIEDSDVFFINNFDVLIQNLKNCELIEVLRKDFPQKFIVGFVQELPHYKNFYDSKKYLVDHTIGTAHESRVPDLKSYSYFPFPMPSKNIYETANSRIPSRVLLSGSFRLARAQLYYKLMSNIDINTVLFYSKNRGYSKDYDGTNSIYPVNFKEKFGDQVIYSSDNTYKDYIKELSLSQVVINYSRQVSSTEGFHLDIDHNMNKISQKQDFEFMSTRVRECALTKTACLSNYDKIYAISGLEEGVHMVTYSSYDDLVDKTKYLSANPELCQSLGENLFNHYKYNYTDIHLIQKIKELV
jgi:hypothetical protein